MRVTESNDSKTLKLISRIIFASRWLQMPIYIVLIFILLLLIAESIKIGLQSIKNFNTLSVTEFVVQSLYVADIALVANLIVVIIISGYSNFITRINIENTPNLPHWMQKLSFTSVKLKISSSIVAIASIILLNLFIKVNTLDNRELLWANIIYGVFVLSALIIAITAKIEKST
jgi:uncharacterized protein (TIGR00645 family)